MKDLIAACSWSSGKDSCLALYNALKQGVRVKYLFNFISAEYQRVSFHGARKELVNLQSESIGIPLIQRETTRENYEEVFKNTLREIKEKGVNKIVRGDIFLLDLKDWVQNMCDGQDMGVISPIWNKPALKLLNEFIGYGFKAVITSCQANKLNEEWIGRIIDEAFIKDIQAIEGVDPCGENGEFHSFVFDGPIFNKKIEILKTEKVFREGYWFLDLQEYNLKSKEK